MLETTALGAALVGTYNHVLHHVSRECKMNEGGDSMFQLAKPKE